MNKLNKLHWNTISLIILITIVINKFLGIFFSATGQVYTTTWFASQLPRVSLRLLFTFLLIYYFINFKNILGWNKPKKYFLVLIPILYYLIRPGLIDYSKFELPSTSLALLIILIGVTQEELFSRGILYAHFKKKTNTFMTILLSSIIFGLLHHSFTEADSFSFDTLIANTILPFFIGLILTTVYHFSKNLLFVILLHFIWNTVNLFWINGIH